MLCVDNSENINYNYLHTYPGFFIAPIIGHCSPDLMCLKGSGLRIILRIARELHACTHSRRVSQSSSPRLTAGTRFRAGGGNKSKPIIFAVYLEVDFQSEKQHTRFYFCVSTSFSVGLQPTVFSRPMHSGSLFKLFSLLW